MRQAPTGPCVLRPSIYHTEGRLSYHQTGIAAAQGGRDEPGLGRARRGLGAVITTKKIPSFAFHAGSGKGLAVPLMQQCELLRARPLQQVPRDYTV